MPPLLRAARARAATGLAEASALAAAYAVASAAAANRAGVAATPALPIGGAVVLALVFVASFDACALYDAVGAEAGPLRGRLARALAIGAVGATATLAIGPFPSLRTLPHLAGVSATVAVALVTRLALRNRASSSLGATDPVFLVGDGRAARALVRELTQESACDVVGFAGLRSPGLLERVRASGAKAVVVAADDRRGAATRELLRCRVAGLTILEASDLVEQTLFRLDVDLLRPSHLIFGRGFERRSPGALSRLGGRALAGATLLACAPILGLATLALWISRAHPRLESVLALDGERPIRVPRLAGTATSAPARRLSAALRRLSVDRLPALWTVLRGELALVGPRPLGGEQARWMRDHLPYFELRRAVPAGLVGWLPARRSGCTPREALGYDLFYARHSSIRLDVIAILTALRRALRVACLPARLAGRVIEPRREPDDER